MLFFGVWLIMEQGLIYRLLLYLQQVSLPEEAEPAEQAKAPTVGALDFFHSDPFTDSRCSTLVP